VGEAILYFLPLAAVLIIGFLLAVQKHHERQARYAKLNHLSDEELDARAEELKATFHRVAGKKYTSEAERARAMEALRELQEVGKRRFCR
jgi:hypothetical protein